MTTTSSPDTRQASPRRARAPMLAALGLTGIALVLAVLSLVVVIVDHSGRQRSSVLLSGLAECDVAGAASQLSVAGAPTYRVQLRADDSYHVDFSVTATNRGPETCSLRQNTYSQGAHRPTLTVDGQTRTVAPGRLTVPVPPDGRPHTVRIGYDAVHASSKAGLGARQMLVTVFNVYPPSTDNSAGPVSLDGVEVTVDVPSGTTVRAPARNLVGVAPVAQLTPRRVVIGAVASGTDSGRYPVRFERPALRTLVHVAPYVLTASVTVLALLMLLALTRRRWPPTAR